MITQKTTGLAQYNKKKYFRFSDVTSLNNTIIALPVCRNVKFL